MSDQLSVSVLQSLTPFRYHDHDMVSEAARTLLFNSIRMDSVIHGTFFPTATAHALLEGVDTRSFPLTKFATAFLAQTITRCKEEFKFQSMLRKDEIETYLRDVYESLEWKKLGFSLYAQLFPEMVRDAKTGICFKDYLVEDSHIWAEKLIAHIMEPSWTREMLKLIVKGKYSEEEYNRDMNVLFVKLHLLDPQSVIPAFQFLLNQRALPAVNLELATRNYLGGPLDYHVIKPEVETALRKPSVPLNVSRLSLDEIEIFYGVRVDEFIVTECRNMGFWTGKRPENYKMSKLKERCSVM